MGRRRSGSCPASKPPAECPNASAVPENYYFCPPGGCINYGVKLVESESGDYSPGKSTCPDLSGPDLSQHSQLADLKPPSPVRILERDPQVGGHEPHSADYAFPHYALKGGEGDMCPNPGSANQPPWGPIPGEVLSGQSFQVNYAPNLNVKVVEAGNSGRAPEQFHSAPGNLILPSLDNMKTYEITVRDPALDTSCVATFKPAGARLQPAFTRTGGASCIPPSGSAMIGASPG